MPCDTRLKPQQTLEQRNAAITASLRRLEAKLTAGTVKVVIGANGAMAFSGWTTEDRDDVVDLCAYRTLTAQGSWALRQAVAKAEATSGRKLSPQAVGAGLHSHDSGKTWGHH